MDIAPVKANTLAFGVKSNAILKGPLEMTASNARLAHTAKTNPDAAPTSATKRLSVKSWRTMRPRLAPIASRIPISCCRAVPRASSRFAMFAQQMSRITATIVIRTCKGRSNIVRRNVHPVPPGFKSSLAERI